jgi:carboxylesterase type B
MFAQTDSNVVVDTHLGPIKGIVNEHQGRKIYTYTRIPYAAPPVGPLRFRKPVDPNPWKEPLEATGKPPICVNFNPDMVRMI